MSFGSIPLLSRGVRFVPRVRVGSPASVVGPTVKTFMAKHVEFGLACLVAVPAQHPVFRVLVLFGHRSPFDLLVEMRPSRRHVHHRATTERAGVISRFQHPTHADLVTYVSTAQYTQSFSGCVKILHAHRTIGPRNLFHTLVIVLEGSGQAHVTLVTVEEVFLASNSADSTSITMKLFLVFIIKESADWAKVFAKLDFTLLAVLLNRLLFSTHKADYFFDFKSIQFMIFFLIVAQPTDVHLVAAWTNVCASAFVVTASVFWCAAGFCSFFSFFFFFFRI